MDFPLPIRSVSSTVDYFKPLHVDTNIEYRMDMDKFPEVNNTLHYCEPALVIATNSYLPSDLCDMELTSFSEDGDISLDVTQEEFQDLLGTLGAEDCELNVELPVVHGNTLGADMDTQTVHEDQDNVNAKKRKRSVVDVPNPMTDRKRQKGHLCEPGMS